MHYGLHTGGRYRSESEYLTLLTNIGKPFSSEETPFFSQTISKLSLMSNRFIPRRIVLTQENAWFVDVNNDNCCDVIPLSEIRIATIRKATASEGSALNCIAHMVRAIHVPCLLLFPLLPVLMLGI